MLGGGKDAVCGLGDFFFRGLLLIACPLIKVNRTITSQSTQDDKGFRPLGNEGMGHSSKEKTSRGRR